MAYRKVLMLSVLPMLLCWLLAGCGGGGFGGAGGSGAVSFTVQWPASAPAPGQVAPALMPEAVRSVMVSLTANGPAVAPPQTVNRESGGPATAQILFENVPTGTVIATATAYPRPDGLGVPLARGTVEIEVVAGQTAQATLVMDTTIVKLTIAPQSAYLPVGDSLQLAVTGRDAADRVVLISPGKLQWDYAAGVISIDADLVATGLSGGSTEVMVTDTESGQSATAEIFVAPSPAPGTVYGTVTDASGQPISGATVAATSHLNNSLTAQVGPGDPVVLSVLTGPDGAYALPGVPVGAHAISASALGYRTNYAIIVMAQGAIRHDAALQTTVDRWPQEPPQIVLDDPVVNETTGLATISGTIIEMDSRTAVLIQNGEDSLLSVTGGEFSQVVVLRSGLNEIRVRASNAVGTTVSPALLITYTGGGTGDFYFRVTLTWDQGGDNDTDVDLHVWSPSNEHCYYSNDIITAGSLDVDNTDGFGPENFTCTDMESGIFRVAVNYYSADLPPTNCVVRVVSGTMAANTVNALFGPHELTVPNSNEGYPVTGDTASWWRACDIELAGNGTVTVTAPDTGVSLSGVSGVGLQQKPRRK